MSLDMNIIPELWSSEIVAQLETNQVFGARMNQMIAAPLASKGDKMHIIGAADVTSGAYTDTADITYTTPTDTDTQLTLDQDFYSALELRDSEVKQANVEWQGLYARRMGYQLADDFDQALAGDHATWTDNYETGTTAWQWGTSAADVPKFFAAVRKQMADADCFTLPGRPYMVLPTIAIQGIQLYLSGKATDLGDMKMVQGMIGQAGYHGTVGGYDIFESTNCVSASSVTHGLAGISGEGIATARAIVPTVEQIRLEGGFKTGIRARHLFGFKTYRAATVFDLNLNDSLLA